VKLIVCVRERERERGREREKEWSYFCFQHVTQSFAVDENTFGSRLDLVVVVVVVKLVKNLALRDQSVVMLFSIFELSN